MGQHEIQRMLPRHYQILDLTLAGNGPKEIAQALGMTPQAISLITSAPLFQNEVARRRANIDRHTDEALSTVPQRAKQLMEDNALLAAQTHVDLLDPNFAPDPKVRQASANAILDRVFGDPSSKQHQVVILEAGAIQLLQLALAESNADGKSAVALPVVETA
jgi:hypothetical protein